MEFEQDSPEFVACIKFLETIKPKRKYSDTIIVIDLVSRSESPKKIAKANILNEETNRITREGLRGGRHSNSAGNNNERRKGNNDDKCSCHNTPTGSNQR